MKAIIFATSIKEGKHSNTRAWCDELNSTFKQNNISSEVITLKDYD
jgi:FMN-dependent NADH-azoreductase